mgnify:FL=1
MSLERRVLPDGTSVFVEVPRKPAFALDYRKAFSFKRDSIAPGVSDEYLQKTADDFEQWSTKKFQLKGNFDGGNNLNDGEFTFPSRNADKDIVNKIGEAVTPWQSIAKPKPKSTKAPKFKNILDEKEYHTRQMRKKKAAKKSRKKGSQKNSDSPVPVEGAVPKGQPVPKQVVASHENRLQKLKKEQIKVVENMVRMAQRAEESRMVQFHATKDPKERQAIAAKMDRERQHSRAMISDMLSMAVGPSGKVIVKRKHKKPTRRPKEPKRKVLPQIKKQSTKHSTTFGSSGISSGGPGGRTRRPKSTQKRTTKLLSKPSGLGGSTSREASSAHASFMNVLEKKSSDRRNRVRGSSAMATARQARTSRQLATPRSQGTVGSSLTTANLRCVFNVVQYHNVFFYDYRTPCSTFWFFVERRRHRAQSAKSSASPQMSAMSTSRVMAMKNSLMQKYASIVKQEHQVRTILFCVRLPRIDDVLDSFCTILHCMLAAPRAQSIADSQNAIFSNVRHVVIQVSRLASCRFVLSLSHAPCPLCVDL